MLPSFHTLMRCPSTVSNKVATTAPSQFVGEHNNDIIAAIGNNNNNISNGIDVTSTIVTSAICSGRGECFNGTCWCEIRYSGDECSGFNLSYHAGISSVFYFVALVSITQLFVCIIAEYQRLKQPKILNACRVTIQKVLYFMVFIAASLRGAYFTTPLDLQPIWAVILMSAYYPLLMTCSSLVVCLWAEIFYLPDVRWERAKFLSKSFLSFVAFNFFLYSLFIAEIFSSLLAANHQEYVYIFNGCYAILLLIVVIFFLIYGIEVFFKLRGGFVYDQNGKIYGPSEAIVNASQLHQSRLGLLSQAIMLIVIVGFLLSETLGDFWKTKVPVYSRNWHDIIFRLAEIGVALWFPCCLWNSMAPEQLWILNPRKLLRRQIDPTSSNHPIEDDDKEGQSSSILIQKDCWICYDRDKMEPLIQPCNCTGDVSSVHHDCLKKWLIKKCSLAEVDLSCKVCGYLYEIQKSKKVDWERGFTVEHWLKTAILITTMCVAGASAWAVLQLYVDPLIRVLTVGTAVLIGYVCIKFLSENTVIAYQRAKVGSINIVATTTTAMTTSRTTLTVAMVRESKMTETERLHTICEDVCYQHST